jgi:hypothetical protein
MATRRTRRTGAGRPRRGLAVFSAAALAVLAAVGFLAPAVLVHTSLRDRPLAAAIAGIDATLTSRSARWSWLSGIEYRDVVLADAAGKPAVLIGSVAVEKGLLALAIDPRQLGTVRLTGLEAVVAVRPGGSSLEDILAPWLAAHRAEAGIACDIELVGGTVELVDTRHGDAWRLTDLFAAGSLTADGSPGDWTVAGRVQHAGTGGEAPAATQPAATGTAPAGEVRLDRSTIPAAAARVLARDGGWSVAAADGSRSIAVTAHRLPLGISSVAATRLGSEHLADGLADIRLDLTRGDPASELTGRLAIERLAICRNDSLAEIVSLPRCELPLDLVVDEDSFAIRELRVISPVIEAEASGRLPLPSSDAWTWLEEAVGRDCSVSARVDLAAAAAALPGGLAVRPDARITGGTLQLAAIARADGDDRLLEVRLDTRDLAAVRTVADGDDPATERPLRWNEPLTAWLRGRRGPGGAAELRIEEGRLASQGAEVAASGTPASLELQWTADLGELVAEVSELLDLGGMRLEGVSRGRLAIERAGGELSEVTLAASVKDFLLGLPGRGTWQDEAIGLDLKFVGGRRDGLAAVERARGMMTAAGDSIEATLSGGILIAIPPTAGPGPRAWIHPAAAGREISADCSLAGDLGRWHRRLAAVIPAIAVEGLDLAGRLEATAEVMPDPTAGADAWRITKAGGGIEDFRLQFGGRQVEEPRIVATAAGRLRPATGQLDISSAEVLSSSLSLRSGGLTWIAGDAGGQPPTDSIIDRLLAQVSGRLQWQADLGRLERWLTPREVADAWPLAGRAWGTFDVARSQTGLTLRAELTGSQMTVAARGPRGEPRPLWREPQAGLVVELTRPLDRSGGEAVSLADRLVIDRLAIESSTFGLSARGVVDQWLSRRMAAIEGSISYDWGQLSRLATPWTGGRIRLAGSVNRPFAVRGSLGAAATSTPASEATAAATDTDPAAEAGTLPLPEAWLAATRSGADPPAEAAVRLPLRPASSRRLADRLREVSLETSAAWAAAEIDGFPIAAGEVAIRLVEGQLAFGPFDLAASGGRLRGAPWLALGPRPSQLIMPPGRIVERVHLSGDLCNRFVALISPLLGQATDTSAVVSIDLAGARLPLADAMAGEAAGQVVFADFEVRPSGAMQPLVNLLGKLQAAVDPRFALSDQPVLLRVRPDPIRLRLADRRVAHQGLVMDSGQFRVTSQGSVGEDGTLSMLVEVAFRGDLAGQTPVIARLLQTPIAIPLKGTLARPQFDAGAIDVTVRRILENTARAVVDEGIGRGLEALFGSPPAPAPAPPARRPPQPLVFPR